MYKGVSTFKKIPNFETERDSKSEALRSRANFNRSEHSIVLIRIQTTPLSAHLSTV